MPDCRTVCKSIISPAHISTASEDTLSISSISPASADRTLISADSAASADSLYRHTGLCPDRAKVPALSAESIGRRHLDPGPCSSTTESAVVLVADGEPGIPEALAYLLDSHAPAGGHLEEAVGHLLHLGPI